jgi:hypothetical protein
MKIDVLILQLALLFLPGLIWAGIDARYASKSKPSDIEFFLRAFLFGLTSYAATFAIYSLFGWDVTVVNLVDAATQPIVTRAILKEVLAATAIGFALGVLWIYIASYKVLWNILRWVHATKRYGDEDVWDFTFNSREAVVEYIHFRDFENKFVYAGWVSTFSETEKLRELVLRDVQVYDFDGKQLYDIPLLYLARPPENLHIEFPYRDGAPMPPADTGEDDERK